MTVLKRFLIDDSGATAIEYALIAALIAIAIIAGASAIGESLNARFKGVADELDKAVLPD